MDIYGFWRAVLAQDAEELQGYFHRDAYVNWPCTNEHFTVEEFIRANCEYPGQWNGEVERVEELNGLLITVVHVYSRDRRMSFHVTSFFRMQEDRIASVEEYWGDDGDAPRWRQEMGIGRPIR